MKTVLTIAGSDCSGGAGIQADIKTMTMHGVYAMSVITAMTAQNTTGVRAIEGSTPDFLKQQLDAVFEDIRPDAVKIGMIPTAELMRIVSDRLTFYRAANIVLDPVMIATSGSKLRCFRVKASTAKRIWNARRGGSAMRTAAPFSSKAATAQTMQATCCMKTARTNGSRESASTIQTRTARDARSRLPSRQILRRDLTLKPPSGTPRTIFPAHLPPCSISDTAPGR